MSGPFIPLLLGAQIVMVASSDPPEINVEATCRTSDREIRKVLGDDTMITFDGCMRQQREALDLLRKGWAIFPTTEKERCVRTENYMPSYVEWLSCLETALSLKNIRAREAETQ